MSDTPSSESDAVAGFEAALSKSFGEAPPPPAEKAEAPPEELEIEQDIDPENPDEDPEKPKTYKVKVDGKELEVPEDELIKGYSRNQDYTKKTMELAAERRQAQEAIQVASQERERYQAQLQQYAALLGQQLQQTPDLAQLLETDPVEYLKQKHLYDQRQAAYQQAQMEAARNEQLTQAQRAQALQQQLQYEQEQLLANLPSWKDEAKATAEKQALAKHLVDRGFTKEQVSQLTDHKTVILAREAMLYRQMMAKAKETTQQVQKLPPRMEKPGVSRPTDGRTADMQALRKSGKAEDAAALFAKML